MTVGGNYAVKAQCGTSSDTILITVFQVGLDISGVPDGDEESVGGFVAFNDNDSDDDGAVDLTDPVVLGEDDMLGIDICIAPSADSGELILAATAGGNKIDMWDGIDKGPTHHVALPKTWNLSSQSPPANTWGAEGISPSSYLLDVELTLSYIRNSVTFAQDRVRLTVIDVGFYEDNSQTYGYDDYTDPFYPRKSVETSSSDTALAPISGGGLATSVYFKSTNTGKVTVAPAQASASPQTVTFTGVTEAYDPPVVALAKLHTLGAYGPVAAVIGVAAFHEDSYTVAVRVVHEDDDDVPVILPGLPGASPTSICVSSGPNGKRDTIKGGDDVYSGENILVGPNMICESVADLTDDMSTDPYTEAELQDYLNNTVYNQAVVKWTVKKLDAKAANFDLNNDGMIDVSSWTTAEMDVVIAECKDDTRDHNIFLVDNPSDNSYGFMQFNQRYGFVHGDTSPAPQTTTAHELGHGAFELTHESGLGVGVNLMTQGGQDKWRLFVDQWSTIHNKSE